MINKFAFPMIDCEVSSTTKFLKYGLYFTHHRKKITRFEGRSEAKIYLQVRVEYSFFLLLAYFWNKNFNTIGINDFVLQGNLVRDIQRPSIGTIAEIIQKLDIENEISKSKKNNEKGISLTEYANLRNDILGHGYSFEDHLESFSEAFDKWYKTLVDLRVQVLSRNCDLVVVQGHDDERREFIGTIYDCDGDIRSNWRCSDSVHDFILGNVYTSFEPNRYFRISPFVHIDAESGDDGLFVFRGIEQTLLGKVRYNRIDKTDSEYSRCWEEFEFSANNGILRRQPNGSIINVFTPNFKKYIEVGSIKEKVYSFLTGKEKDSSVCITLWGHGGNGKTATVQKICAELSLSDSHSKQKLPPFEFIFFLSAKDRELNKFTGKIDIITSESRISNFQDLVENLNLLLYGERTYDYKRIVNEKSKMLIVIDDYETLEDIDKEQITEFIRQLKVGVHKVIITTRNSFLKIGDDIQTNELDLNNTRHFMLEVLESEHGYTKRQLEDLENELNKNDALKEVHKITLGKPIEIIRFINCFIQKGRITEDFLKEMRKINSRSERIEFLYGRNYQQLKGDRDAQDIFVALGLLTPSDTLTSLVKHIKVILNKKDEDEGKFNAALDKLAKLRLIELADDGSYRLDSKDILEIMKKEFDQRDNNFKSQKKSIYDRIKLNITLDTDRAILNHVKSLRHQSNAETTIQQYKEVLKQGKDFSREVKLEALLDLTDFLFNHRGEKEIAIRTFDDYFDDFYEFQVLKRYANYTWAVSKKKSIKLLSDFYANHSHRGLTLPRNQRLHLLALIVMREGQYWNDRFDREYNNKSKNTSEIRRIYKNYGHLLFKQIKSYNPRLDLTSEEINDLSLAFENLIDICYRIGNGPLAISICDYLVRSFPESNIYRFRKKLDKLQGLRLNYQPSTPKSSSFGDSSRRSRKI